MSRAALIAFAAAVAVAGAAQAGSAEDALRAAVMAPRPAASSPSDGPNARIVLADRYAEAYALRSAGIATTAVSETEDEITRSLGFLCGIQPGQKPTGAAAARGYDPSGRFVGAQFRVALK